MANPTPVTRVAPSGHKIKNGYQALLAFELDPNLDYFEVAVGLPGIDIGDPVDNTTQQNTVYRTTAARQLLTLTPFQVTAGYSATVYNQLLSIAGIEQNITVRFPDNSTITFYGFLQTVEFDQLVDGDMPKLTMTITPTNYDPNNCVEAGPLLHSYGTC